ncbi:MAG: hypothetical protein RSB71_04370 [Bacilli bacterium]
MLVNDPFKMGFKPTSKIGNKLLKFILKVSEKTIKIRRNKLIKKKTMPQRPMTFNPLFTM